MSRLHTSFVLGYHGCDRSVGKRIVNGEIRLLQSRNEYDWLGNGAYFWESDPQRAMEWARDQKTRKRLKEPFVIGAVIDLGNCLDLTMREDAVLVRDAEKSFRKMQQRSNLPMPKNKSLPGKASADNVMRYLDCAVINHLHEIVEKTPDVPPYDTVRALFTEGGPLYGGAGFASKSHCQITVRNMKCIKGLFIPLG